MVWPARSRLGLAQAHIEKWVWPGDEVKLSIFTCTVIIDSGGRFQVYAMEDYCPKKAKLANCSEKTDFCVLRVKRMSEMGFIPTRGSAHAAGYDLYRCRN